MIKLKKFLCENCNQPLALEFHPLTFNRPNICKSCNSINQCDRSIDDSLVFKTIFIIFMTAVILQVLIEDFYNDGNFNLYFILGHFMVLAMLYAIFMAWFFSKFKGVFRKITTEEAMKIIEVYYTLPKYHKKHFIFSILVFYGTIFILLAKIISTYSYEVNVKMLSDYKTWVVILGAFPVVYICIQLTDQFYRTRRNRIKKEKFISQLP